MPKHSGVYLTHELAIYSPGCTLIGVVAWHFLPQAHPIEKENGKQKERRCSSLVADVAGCKIEFAGKPIQL